MNGTARFWIATIPTADWQVPDKLPEGWTWASGQQEIGAGGFCHWQIVFRTAVAVRRAGAKAKLPRTAYLEATRSAAANAYVQKDASAVAGSRFTLGTLVPPGKNKVDWPLAVRQARAGDWDNINPQLLARHFNNFKGIHAHFAVPQERPGISLGRVYWGSTGTGKTHRAWEEAKAMGAVYIKSPSTKWWDGYKGQEQVILDEFDGQIGITHLLRWLDKYPCSVEIKGGQVPLKALHFWITSNKRPEEWYPATVNSASGAQVSALLARLRIEEMTGENRRVRE